MINHATRSDRAEVGETFWVDRLREAHADLIEAIEQLAKLTSGSLPDRQMLIDLRWAVSRSSLARRLLWGQIHALLGRSAGATVERDLRHLQELDAELIQASAKHVGSWTTDAIVEDWEGYCQASELMRGQMLDAIAEEKRLLYPILSSVASAKSRRHPVR
jgi:hypothetical protein